jgi:hypothetical protein
MIATSVRRPERLSWAGMWTWTLVRFVHLARAGVWLGMQVTLAVRGTRARIAASARMLVLTLAATLAGAYPAES